MRLPLNNAELLLNGMELPPGEAGKLYGALYDILENRGEHRTWWGFLPWVMVSKIRSYLFGWSCTAHLSLP